jgi:serine/threonine protein kinase
MPAPASNDELLELTRKSGVLEEKRLDGYLQSLRDAGHLPAEPAKLAEAMVRDAILTNFQAEQLMQGKWRRFSIGKYKVLERLGSGGMGSVFLCEHKFMRRRVAVKVLPTAKAADPSSLERFYREARAAAALDHPNIVHAYDNDQDENLHFIVMEYVDGPSLQEIVRRTGPVSVARACHYISQAALALEHANAAGLVHRDIKPGNILVDRTGVVKILDMGLARFFNNDEDDMITRKYDENVLGTADYLAPEQADDSHTVDIRADIYSLGGTFYFLLTGKTPFGDGSVPQKLMWHRTRQPKPLSAFRGDVPPELQAILDKMMAKEPDQRYRSAEEIATALSPWTHEPIDPPTASEMPRLSPAVTGSGAFAGSMTPASGPGSGSTKKIWQVTGAPVTPPSSGSANQNQSTPGLAPATGQAGSSKVSAPTPSPSPAARPQPRPAAAPAAPAARAVAPTVVASRKTEGSSPWTAMAPETPRPGAKATSPARAPARPKADAKTEAANSSQRRTLWLFVLMSLLFLAALGSGVAYFGFVARMIRFFSP